MVWCADCREHGVAGHLYLCVPDPEHICPCTHLSEAPFPNRGEPWLYTTLVCSHSGQRGPFTVKSATAKSQPLCVSEEPHHLVREWHPCLAERDHGQQGLTA